MIISLGITKEHEKAILLRYPSVKFFLQKMILNTAEQIIIDQDNFDVEGELKEYHNRRVLNGYNIHKRKCTQATKDLISKSLKEKYRGKEFHLFEETKMLIGLGNKGKVLSQETKDKISKKNSGLTRTKEQRENISLGKKGMKLSEEHKKNIGLAHKGRKYKSIVS